MENKELHPLNNALGIDVKIIERFLSKVNRDGPNGCWIWTASRSRQGYGQFRFRGQPIHAHRLSYRLSVGPIPDGKHLHHKCQNPACVNPVHLEVLTPREHMEASSPNHSAKRLRNATHCKHGHEFTPENTYMYHGFRTCRVCNSARSAVKYHKFREQNPLTEKTHCIHGHPLSGENLYIYTTPKGGIGRGCKICRLAVVNAYTKRNHESVLAKKAVRREAQRKQREQDRDARLLEIVNGAREKSQQELLAELKQTLRPK
jgi:hypothetical protein